MRHFAIIALIGWVAVARCEEIELSPLETAVSNAQLIAIIEVSDVERYQGGGGHRPFITISTGKCTILETISVKKTKSLGDYSMIENEPHVRITSTDDAEFSLWAEQLRNGRFLAFLNCEFDYLRNFDSKMEGYLGVTAVWGALSPVQGDKIAWRFGHNHVVSKVSVVEQIRNAEALSETSNSQPKS